jgi:hypothetical protein
MGANSLDSLGNGIVGTGTFAKGALATVSGGRCGQHAFDQARVGGAGLARFER